MESTTEKPSPSLGLVFLLITIPIGSGVALLFLFETGPIHRLGLYMVGVGVLVGGILILWRRR